MIRGPRSCRCLRGGGGHGRPERAGPRARPYGGDPLGTPARDACAARAGTLVRNSAGPAGLAAIGAAAWGGVAAQVTTWLLQPSGTSVACWTAVALAAGGGLLCAPAGPRR
ncbi:hypothetical protein ACFXBB_14135 [Streptomyces scopuliridis]|uniref:hypothetical protein n=1 Tax=Streptomyces scopuliridis TaxID=452529 RepID=UPI0036930534